MIDRISLSQQLRVLADRILDDEGCSWTSVRDRLAELNREAAGHAPYPALETAALEVRAGRSQ